MSLEQTLVIIKPDGIAKGLVGQILRAFEANGLWISRSAHVQLSREFAEDLYGLEREQSHFPEVVGWISSAPVLVLMVEGEDAVGRVKWQIIGRYPNGIRGQYAENYMKNVAHAPDSVEAATRELGLAAHLFERNVDMNSNRFSGRLVFALTGMSESGKSTVGEHLDSKGVKRLKIVKLFQKVRDRWSPSEDLHEFVRRQEEKDPYALWDAFIDELIGEMDRAGASSASIESLYGGGFGPYLKRKLGANFCLVFVDIPVEVRIQRQMIRENLSSIEDARQFLLPRDEIKEKSGIPALKMIADEVIDNVGTLEDLRKSVDEVLKRKLL